MTPVPAITYSAGTADHLLIASGRLAVLIPADCAAHIAALWPLVRAESTMDDLLEWLVDNGFRAFSSLVAVERQGDTARLLLRGESAVTALDAEGAATQHTGADRRTWLDVTLRRIAAVQWDAPGGAGVERYPLAEGVVAASGFFIALDDADIVSAAMPVAPQSPSEPSAGEPMATQAPVPDDPQDGLEAPVDQDADADGAGDRFNSLTLAPQLFDASQEAHRPAPVLIDAGDLPTTGEPADDFDQVFGRTRQATVEQAAVREAETADDSPAVEAPQAGGRPAPQASEQQPSDDSGDHDGHTITTAELARLRGAAATAAPAQQPEPAPGRVRAVLCDQGHPNPPNEVHCRVCGGSLEHGEIHTVPRPVLGVLVFGEGPVVPLDGNVIIGRAPRMPTTMRSAVPTLVPIASPEHGVSRSHLEIRVEGWSVSVIDLGSTNGTEVVLPGEAPRRLRRGEPCLVTPGTVITLGDEVTGTYKVTP